MPSYIVQIETTAQDDIDDVMRRAAGDIGERINPDGGHAVEVSVLRADGSTVGGYDYDPALDYAEASE